MKDLILPNAAGLAILFFPALLIGIVNGGATALLLLLLISIIGLMIFRTRERLNVHERFMLFVVLLYIAIYGVNVWYFEARVSELDNTLRFLLLLPIFFFVRKKSFNVQYLKYGVVVATLVCAVFAGYQKFILSFERVNGITNWVSFGGLSITLGMMSLVFGAYGRSMTERLIFIIGFFLAVLASLLSGSRGAWLALLPGFLLLLYFNPFKYSNKVRVGLLVGFSMMILGSYLHPIVQQRVDNAIEDIHLYTEEGRVFSSLGLRLEAWKASGIAYSQSPWMGIGEGNFRSMLQRLVDEGQIHQDVMHINHVHNEFISAALHRGVPGLISVLLIFLIPFVSFLNVGRRSQGCQQALAISGAMLVVCSVTVAMSDIFFGQHQHTIFYVAYIYLIYALAITPDPGRPLLDHV